MMDTVVACLAVLAGCVFLHVGYRFVAALRARKAWERARAALKRGELGAAERNIKRCIKYMPERQSTRFLLSTVLAEQGKLAEAEEELKQAQLLRPHKPDGFLELGVFYVTAAHRVADGVAAFHQALSCDDTVWARLEEEPRLAAFRTTPAYAAMRQEANG